MEQPAAQSVNFILVKSDYPSLVAPQYCNNFYEEIEGCQGLICNNWGLSHHKKIYDVSASVEVAGKEASEQPFLRDLIKPNQTVYYAGQVHRLSGLDAAKLIAEIKKVRKQQGCAEPFVLLFARIDDFQTLKVVWARNHAFTETASRFFAALIARVFSKSAWLSPSTGILLFLLTAGAGILFSQVLPHIFNQVIFDIFMGVAWAGILLAGPLFLRFVYKDYDRCKAHKHPIAYNFFDYLGEISPRLYQWADKNFFQSAIVGVGAVGSLVALFLTIAFYTNGFALFPGVFEFMSPVFSFLQTAMPIVFPGEFLSVHAVSIVGAIIASVAFIMVPFFTAISIQRFVSTLIEAGDRSVDPYHQDAPKGERKLLSEPYPWQIQSCTPMPDIVGKAIASRQYNDSEESDTVSTPFTNS